MTPSRRTKAELLAEVEALRAALKGQTAEAECETAAKQRAEQALTEAQEQQTATSEILRIISSSPTNEQPVFDAIVQSAVTLCGAILGAIYRREGSLVHVVGLDPRYPHAEDVRAVYPAPLTSGLMSCRAIHENVIIQMPDTETPGVLPPEGLRLARLSGFRSVVAVPMRREGESIGAILVGRPAVGAFPDEQIALLQTFADQAVIAIENVRLFKELQARNAELTQAHAQMTEALEQQTATSEILRVIASSPTNVQPVFDAIAEAAMRLCVAHSSLVTTFDGELLHLVAQADLSAEGREAVRDVYPRRPIRGFASGRSVMTRAIVQIPDLMADPEFDVQVGAVVARVRDFRSILAVPMLRDGLPIGTINAHKAQPGPFTDQQVALLQTFADQAVIAIENVRLFTELQEKNRALTTAHAQVTEALEQQTATSEILRVISSSPTDVQPVFDTILRSAVRLCDGFYCALFLVEGEMLYFRASHNIPSPALEDLERAYPTAVRRGSTGTARAVRDRCVVHTLDMQEDPEIPEGSRQRARVIGHRSWIGVPMLREGTAIGAIAVSRSEVKPFSEAEIALLQTFAAQAVIAIENVRLFKELETKNASLTEALDTQTATSDILRVISGSRTDVRPVFDAIVQSAVRLLRSHSGMLTRIEGERLELAAFTSIEETYDTAMRTFWPRPLNSKGTHTLAIRDREPVNISDAASDPRVPEDGRAVVRLADIRSVVSVPLLRHGEAIGTIAVNRREAGGFTGDEIALLQTFADQAVIAIENSRLLTELQTRTAELTRSVGELTALGQVGRALSSTLDLETVLQTIVLRANELAGTAGCTIWEYDETREEFRLRASDYAYEEDAAALQAVAQVTTIRKGLGVTTQVMERRQPVQVEDIAVEGADDNPIRSRLIAAGHRALLGVPLLSEDEVIGVLAVTRKTPGEFQAEVVRLLSTFATQSALAIQNARLFREIEQKSQQLEAVSRHKSEFLANMSHELRTPLNAIIGYSEMLQEDATDLGQTGFVEDLHRINDSARHLLSLINDILDLSKVEAGRMELDLADFDLLQAIEDALILMQERANRRGITVERVVDERLGLVHADERKVKQVLLNLLSNAVKFTPEGGRIDVRAGLVDDAVEISVTDTGIGIAPDDRAAVFEEFRQVGSTAKKVEGTGLGLALCRKFVELHGGRIWVKSQVGVGSTFTFTIPVRTAAQAP